MSCKQCFRILLKKICCCCFRPPAKTPTHIAEDEDLSSLSRPSEVNLELEFTIGYWETAIEEYRYEEHEYLLRDYAKHFPLILELRGDPLSFLKNSDPSIKGLALKIKRILEFERRLGLEYEEGFGKVVLPTSVDVSQGPQSNPAVKLPIYEPNPMHSNRSTDMTHRLSVKWASHLGEVNSANEAVLVPVRESISRSGILKAPSIKINRVRPRWPNHLVDLAFEVLKVNSVGKRLLRTLKLTEYHIINIKNQGTISKVHRYIDISSLRLESSTMIRISIKSGREITYISPIASHILQQITTRIQTRLTLEKTFISGQSEEYSATAISNLILQIADENESDISSPMASFAFELGALALQYTNEGNSNIDCSGNATVRDSGAGATSPSTPVDPPFVRDETSLQEVAPATITDVFAPMPSQLISELCGVGNSSNEMVSYVEAAADIDPGVGDSGCVGAVNVADTDLHHLNTAEIDLPITAPGQESSPQESTLSICVNSSETATPTALDSLACDTKSPFLDPVEGVERTAIGTDLVCSLSPKPSSSDVNLTTSEDKDATSCTSQVLTPADSADSAESAESAPANIADRANVPSPLQTILSPASASTALQTPPNNGSDHAAASAPASAPVVSPNPANMATKLPRLVGFTEGMKEYSLQEKVREILYDPATNEGSTRLAFIDMFNKGDRTLPDLRSFIDGMHEYILTNRALYLGGYLTAKISSSRSSSSSGRTPTGGAAGTSGTNKLSFYGADASASTKSDASTSMSSAASTGSGSGRLSGMRTSSDDSGRGSRTRLPSSELIVITELSSLRVLDEAELATLSYIVYAVIEESMIAPLNDIIKIMLPSSKKLGDEKRFLAKIKSISSREQCEWGITEEFMSPLGWQNAIFELSTLEHSLTPSMQLLTLARTAKAIYAEFKVVVLPKLLERGQLDVHLGADALVPIFLYVMSRSDLQQPLLNNERMWALSHPGQLSRETGYYLTVYESCLDFIENEVTSIEPFTGSLKRGVEEAEPKAKGRSFLGRKDKATMRVSFE